MELRWLQDFLMVAETGNFTRAAERRNTSQAAFSRRIKSLEAWLGFDLIDRSVYPTQLTSQGEQFREHAGELLRPYASQALVAKGGASLPGRISHPVPLLMYSPGVYFARLVDLILESTP